MKNLYTNSPLPQALRLLKWNSKVTIRESSFGTCVPQAHDIADKALKSIRKRKNPNNPLKFYGESYLQIIKDEVSDCLRLHMAQLSTPPKYKYTITITVENSYVTASVISAKE